MSDTLPEREDQMDQHQVNKSGTCVIPGCPCRGWSAQETAGKTQFWVSHHGSDWHLKGAPCAQCDGQHQPAARGAGDEWRVFNFTRDGTNEWMVTTATGRTVALSNVNDPKLAESEMRQIASEHNQHQALVAERDELRRVMRIIRDSYWSENEPYSERVEYLQEMAKAALQQRSTSE